ncbi:MAG: amino acid racemase [Thermoplasmata archaeon]|nr:amino acid racemase [Thermoplasmata archaeon]
MKKIGVVGGLSPESTILYYNHIVKRYYEIKGNYNFPEIIIYSLSFGKFSEAVKRKNAPEEILKALEALKKAGADFAIISANTPHIFFDEIADASPLPVISIIDATIEKAKEYGLRKLLLLGTIFTMESEYFKNEYEKNGIEIVVPSKEERKVVNEIIFNELAKGIVKEKSRKRLLEIVESYNEVDGIILGCTELPLILQQEHVSKKLLDTATIHAEKALMHALES